MRLPLAVGAGTLAAVLYLALTDPYRPGGHLVCPLLLLTGLSCPACGAQRAVHSLAHGDVPTAWGTNPLLVALTPVAVVAWAGWLRRSARAAGDGDGRGAVTPQARSRASAASAWALLVAVLAFGVLRNVPALAPVLGP